MYGHKKELVKLLTDVDKSNSNNLQKCNLMMNEDIGLLRQCLGTFVAIHDLLLYE